MTCPLCKLPMPQAGRLIAYKDDVGQHFVFSICPHCAGRLEALPLRRQQRQLEAAVSELARHPQRYEVTFLLDRDSTTLFVHLECERLQKVLWEK